MGYLNYADIYNTSSNNWTTSYRAETESYLSATTVGNLAMFTGGDSFSGAVHIFILPCCSELTGDNSTCVSCLPGTFTNAFQCEYPTSAPTYGTVSYPVYSAVGIHRSSASFAFPYLGLIGIIVLVISECQLK